MRHVLTLALVLIVTVPAAAQTLQQRINDLERRRAAQREASPEAQAARTLRERLRTIIDSVNLDAVRARDAFTWYTQTTGVPLVIHWEAMQNEGIDPDAPVSVNLQSVPARQLLRLMLQSLAPDVDFVYEVESSYVQVLTKAQANRMLVTAVFDVNDLLVEVPHFDDAPRFDLQSALEGGGSGSSGGRSGEGLFGDDDDDADREPTLTKAERGQRLADLIRSSIEPDIWETVGGPATITYWNGYLIVRAPKYVQRQIGIPVRARVPVVTGSLRAETSRRVTPQR